MIEIFFHARGAMRRIIPSVFSAAFILMAMTVCTLSDRGGSVHAEDAAGQGEQPAMTGGCRECHAKFYSSWSVSSHGLSLQSCTKEFARRNLVPQEVVISVGGVGYLADFSREPGIMRKTGTWPWENKEYRITHALGGRGVYYFFTPARKGGLMTLPLAYDVREKAWKDAAATGTVHARVEKGPWEDTALTFDTACYGCHVDSLATNYDFKTDSYHTVPPEPGIRCEACHGPVEQHAAVMKGISGGAVPADLRIIRVGGDPEGRLNTSCAPCHAKMSPITNEYRPGEPFFDHFNLVALENPGYFPDGRDTGGNHTYTSWLMNPCAGSGKLDCLHCHTPGGGSRIDDKTPANSLCLPCHGEIVSDPDAHTHHGSLSKGSMCISCHMPGTGESPARHADHSFLPPSPASSRAFGSPDACTMCHKDKDDAWADQWVRKWFPDDYQAPVLKRAGLVRAARDKDWSQIGAILSYIGSDDRDEVSAASLIRLIGDCPDPARVPALRAALKDRSPLVRSSAAEGLGGVLSPEVIQGLLDATGDPVRLVRVKAASALMQHGKVALPEGYARDLGKATGEYLASMMVRQDHWTSHHAMGNYFLEQGDAKNALMAYMAASKLDPRAVPPHVSASIALAKLGNLNKAEEELNTALRIDPKNALALYNMGLLKNEQGKSEEAITCLKEALKVDPTMAPAAFNLGVILSADRVKEAITWSRRAYELRPDAKYGYTLAYFLKQGGDWNEGIDVLRQVIGRYPLYADAYLLLGEIFERKGKIMDAEEVYHQGMSVEGMPDFEINRIEKRLKNIR